MNKYYSLQRPVGIGTFPSRISIDTIYNYQHREIVNGVNAWGFFTCEDVLTPEECDHYSLALHHDDKVLYETEQDVAKFMDMEFKQLQRGRRNAKIEAKIEELTEKLQSILGHKMELVIGDSSIGIYDANINDWNCILES